MLKYVNFTHLFLTLLQVVGDIILIADRLTDIDLDSLAPLPDQSCALTILDITRYKI